MVLVAECLFVGQAEISTSDTRAPTPGASLFRTPVSPAQPLIQFFFISADPYQRCGCAGVGHPGGTGPVQSAGLWQTLLSCKSASCKDGTIGALQTAKHATHNNIHTHSSAVFPRVSFLLNGGSCRKGMRDLHVDVNLQGLSSRPLPHIAQPNPPSSPLATPPPLS
eukprot:2043268-Rhodomonas_salina.1